VSSLGVSGICVRNDSELASASLSASLVFFERRSSSCMVIRAGILASWVNISKQKGMLSPGPEGFFRNNQTGLLSASLFSRSGSALAWVLVLTSFAVVSRQ